MSEVLEWKENNDDAFLEASSYLTAISSLLSPIRGRSDYGSYFNLI